MTDAIETSIRKPSFPGPDKYAGYPRNHRHIYHLNIVDWYQNYYNIINRVVHNCTYINRKLLLFAHAVLHLKYLYNYYSPFYRLYYLKEGNSCYYSVQTLLSSWLLSKNLKIKIYKTIILPVVLYGSEAWSLTLREECRLRVFKNRILRRISVPKRDENGEWRRLHNEELHSLYRSLNVVKSRRLRWSFYSFLCGKH